MPAFAGMTTDCARDPRLDAWEAFVSLGGLVPSWLRPRRFPHESKVGCYAERTLASRYSSMLMGFRRPATCSRGVVVT